MRNLDFIQWLSRAQMAWSILKNFRSDSRAFRHSLENGTFDAWLDAWAESEGGVK